MASTSQYKVRVHMNGETYHYDTNNFLFRNTNSTRFSLNRQADFSYLKRKIDSKIREPVSQIFYRQPLVQPNNSVKFYQSQISNDLEVQNMFLTHEHFGYDYLELYIVVEQNAPSQNIQSQVIDPVVDDEQQPEHVIDEETDIEDVVDELVNRESEDEGDEEVPVPDRVPETHAYSPPAHFTTLNLGEDEPSSDMFYNPYMRSSEELKEGDTFRSKDDCLLAIKNWHLANCVDFKADRSNPERVTIACKNPECGYMLKASFRKKFNAWVIRSISQAHTCVTTNMAQDHRKLSHDMICHTIIPLVETDPSLKVKTIISHCVFVFKYRPSYRKAWLAKQKAIEKVYGNWEESYQQLPRYLAALQLYSPGTVSILETLPAQSQDGTPLEDNGIFHRLFWAFRPCIVGFGFCKPIIQIDGTWLYGKYKGTLLMAVAQDGNSNIFPIAFALVEGETPAAWGFFLKNLRARVAPQPNLCLISDRHASIDSAYNNPENGWHNPPSKHVYCIRHIAQNFIREIKDKFFKNHLVNAGYALNQPGFQYYRREIALTNPDAGRWIDSIDRARWTRSYDDGARWGHMTTNLVESMNGVFKGIRNLPVTAIVSATYFRMASLFATRGKRWHSVLQTQQVYSDVCMKYIQQESAKANTHRVTEFDRHGHTFSVKETIDHNQGLPRQQYRVNIPDRWCDCGQFQAYRMPCSHVLAACSHTHFDALSLVSEIYKVSTLLNVYDNYFPVVAMEAYWPVYEGETV